ncbi:MAG: sigma-70 family RNA polymerase sigma factor [Eubacteriales bacterium]|nr:sigma-70 family RNA polymerase sigma factor [Eubacteriales bacterium]
MLRAAQGDEDAFAQAVTENLPLVAHIAKRFGRAEAEYEDLFQTGCIGLMKAIRRYEPGFGTAFSTYAVPVIMGEMRRLLRDGGQVHVARSIREKAALIARCEQEHIARTGEEPDFAQLCAATGLSREEIALSYGARRPLVSLDAPAPGMEHMTNAELIPGKEEGEIEEGIVLRQLLGALEEQDRRLIELRYRAGKTQAETGELLGMTQVQVCRREKKLLRQMREASGTE